MTQAIYMNELPRIENIQHRVFHENGGFFPVLLRHGREALVFFRTGGGHYGKDGRVEVRASRDGLAWSDPVVAAQGQTDMRNPCAGVFADGSLLLAAMEYDVYHGDNDTAIAHGAQLSIHFFSSPDGHAWQPDHSRDTDLPQGSAYGRFVHFNGELIMPYYYAVDGAPRCCFMASTDQGSHWDERPIAHGFVEPALAAAGDTLIAALRGWEPVAGTADTYVRRSTDGCTWTEPERVTSGMAHPADLTPLDGDAVLLTYAERNSLNQRILARLSTDRGVTWREPVQLTDPVTDHDFGYPSTVILESGLAATAYYLQPGLLPGYSNMDAMRYSPEGCTGRILVYSPDEIYDKSL